MNIRNISCTALMMIIPWVAFAQTTFTKIIDFPDHTALFIGAAWGDFDGDGFLDLFGGGSDTTNFLFHNNRNGTFTRIIQGDPVLDIDNHIGSAWGDYDNDGNLDLLVSAGARAATPRINRLFRNNGNGTFVRSSAGTSIEQPGFYGPCAWADYDNDGFLDFFISAHARDFNPGKDRLFHNNGDGTFTQITNGSIVNDLSASLHVHWVDYDSDGFMDLLVTNNNFETGGVNFLYHNERNGTFARVRNNVIATDRWNEAVQSAWGDYDNDGLQDLFVIAAVGGRSRLYHNEGNGTFTTISSGPMLSPPPGGESRGCSWVDYDNDGFLDLFVTNAKAKPGLFRNSGDGTFSQILSGAPIDDGGLDLDTATTTSWADYDNDGFLDLLLKRFRWADFSISRLDLYHNDGNGNAWLEVKCVGTVANRSAIGTKVRVRASIGGKTFWQLREINSPGGHNSMPLVACFGLGDATNADTVRIEWPSGTVQEFHTVPAKQIMTIIEPPRLQALGRLADGSLQLSLTGGLGLTYDLQISSNLVNWSTWTTVTNTNRTMTLADTSAANAPGRFYRAASR